MRFDLAVPNSGYVWWYLDALSDDGQFGLTLIAFIGSVFSPYYAWARRRGGAEPLNHCAFNIALYGSRSQRWTMTERGSSQVQRDAATLRIGPSDMRWTGEALEIDLNEMGAPLPRRVRGKIKLIPSELIERGFPLDEAGRHRWTPFAPRARVEVALSQPRLRWSGTGYLDSNSGTEPLERAFSAWTWSRMSAADSTVVLYDVCARACAADAGASERSLALKFTADGRVEAIAAPPVRRLPMTKWRTSRHTRADPGEPVRLLKTLEDAPFYSRSLLSTCLLGERAEAIHESLDLDRFRSGWVQCLLPFRMPRVAFRS